MLTALGRVSRRDSTGRRFPGKPGARAIGARPRVESLMVPSRCAPAEDASRPSLDILGERLTDNINQRIAWGHERFPMKTILSITAAVFTVINLQAQGTVVFRVSTPITKV